MKNKEFTETELVAGELISKLYKNMKTNRFELLNSLEMETCDNGSVDLKWYDKKRNLHINISRDSNYFSYYGESKKKKIESPEAVTFSKFYREDFYKIKDFLKSSA